MKEKFKGFCKVFERKKENKDSLDLSLKDKEKTSRIVVVGCNLLGDGGVKTLENLQDWEDGAMNMNITKLLRGTYSLFQRLVAWK